MFSKEPSHKYRPLKPASQPAGEFRILTLLPGRKESKIECKLEHASFAEHPPYDALSYTWGSPKYPRNGIPVNGNPKQKFRIQVEGKRMDITYNLEGALQSLRDETKTVVLWVDALCIDQSNLEERSEQVEMMASIYSQACRVILWLGESDSQCEKAFDTLEEISWATKARIWQYCARKLKLPLSEIFEDTVTSLVASELENDLSWNTSPFMAQCLLRNGDSFSRALAQIPLDFSKCSNPMELAFQRFGDSGSLAKHLLCNDKLAEFPDLRNRLESIRYTFLERTYWDRIWIIQELHHARRIVLVSGVLRFDFDKMALVTIALSKYVRVGDGHIFENGDRDSVLTLAYYLSNLRDYYNQIHYRHAKNQIRTLAANLQQYAGRFASDPRDKIYALLNISQPVGINIDYSKSISEVWIDATRSIIAHEQSLDMICMLPTPLSAKNVVRKPSEKLPSWLPQFEEEILGEGGLFTLSEARDEQFYRGGGVLSYSINDLSVKDARVLSIRGCSLGHIKDVQPKFRWFHKEDEMIRPFLERPPPLISPSDINDFWRTLVMDVYPRDDETLWRISLSSESRANHANDMATALASKTAPARLRERLDRSLSNKAQCRTSMGEVALVLGDAGVGDQVFCARGATCLFVIRRTGREKPYKGIKQTLGFDNLWRLMGGAFILDRMDGEPLRDMEMEEQVEETILLI